MKQTSSEKLQPQKLNQTKKEKKILEYLSFYITILALEKEEEEEKKKKKTRERGLQ